MIFAYLSLTILHSSYNKIDTQRLKTCENVNQILFIAFDKLGCKSTQEGETHNDLLVETGVT